MDLSNLNFKAASVADKASLLQLMKKYYEFDYLVFSEPKAERAIAELLKNPNLGQIWLMDIQAKIIGYVALTYSFGIEFGGRVAFIDELFVDESHRGMGIGSAAVRWCMQACRDQGIGTLRLEVTPTNAKALGLYTHLGFINHNRSLLTYELK